MHPGRLPEKAFLCQALEDTSANSAGSCLQGTEGQEQRGALDTEKERLGLETMWWV